MVNASEVSQDELARYYEALGPIRDLVLDDSLTEVMVNGYENIYVERNGKILYAAELQLHQKHVCRMESRPPDLNGENKVGIRELVINALRMRPDRIVVG